MSTMRGYGPTWHGPATVRLMGKNVEEVFKVSGVPSHTFVPPTAFGQLKVALRTPGRGVVLEGPSGIGKSTAISRALTDIGATNVTELSARNPEDLEYLELLPELEKFGTVVIDDFHRLSDRMKNKLSDLLKVTSDTADPTRKLVIIGINDAGRALIESSRDVADRIEVIRFEVESEARIKRLIAQGEEALNVSIRAKEAIAENAGGSFFVAQLLCLHACIDAGFIESVDGHEEIEISTPYTTVQRRVVERQREKFGEGVRRFARGTKFRPGGRAPYLHILRWLAESSTWSISIPDQIHQHPSEKASVTVVLERGYLANLVNDVSIAPLLHFDEKTKILSVEDPMLVFYLRNIVWAEFVREVGFKRVDYTESYDIALSFAGEDREYAQMLHDVLVDNGYAVFYDFAEQHRLLANDVEEYLGPIYESGSRYVVAVLGKTYGNKRWTLFEADKYRNRLSQGHVIPIWSIEVPTSPYDDFAQTRGRLSYDPHGDLLVQAQDHGETISRKLDE